MGKWIIRPIDKEDREWFQIEETFDSEKEAWEYYEEEANAITDDYTGELEVVEVKENE